jgi:outer membrane protein OmpA-like peptidoglycan-associated protein
MYMGYVVRLTIIAAGLAFASAGCVATERWTQDVLGKRQAEMDTRFVKVETDVREHGERLDKVEGRVTELENRPVRTAAFPERTSPVVVRSTPQRTLIGVMHVPFGFDRADLVPSAEIALATLISELRDDPQMSVDLEGTTDPIGSRDYNVKLSRRRVEAVRRRLLQEGVEPTRIVSSTARGPLLDKSVTNDFKRQVMIKLMKSSD